MKVSSFELPRIGFLSDGSISLLFSADEIIFEGNCKLVLEFWLLFNSRKVSCYWCYRLSYCSIILQRVPCRCERIFLIFSLIDSSETSSSDDEGGSCSLLCSFFKMALSAILLLKSTSYSRRSSATIANTGARFILTFRGRYFSSLSISMAYVN